MNLFLTGMPRSGTTLLDKLLSGHRQVQVLSQPLQPLYVEVKRRFLRQLRGQPLGEVEHRYPLHDLFGDLAHPPEAFPDYLQQVPVGHDVLAAALGEVPESLAGAADGASLFDAASRYLAASKDAPPSPVLGAKEVFCEELIPYFLESGTRVLLILRDPRDVLTSLNYGQGPRYTGRPKPDLFNIRQWRKSVAFALQYEGRDGFLTLRYEDLVRQPEAVGKGLASFLGVEDFPAGWHERPLTTKSGEPWVANSSHAAMHRISASSVGRYRQHLETEVERFVQAACWPEMRYLGYALDVEPETVPEVFRAFRDTTPLERAELASYRWSAERRTEEASRWQCLRQGRFAPAFFPFEAAFDKLAKTLRDHPTGSLEGSRP